MALVHVHPIFQPWTYRKPNCLPSIQKTSVLGEAKKVFPWWSHKCDAPKWKSECAHFPGWRWPLAASASNLIKAIGSASEIKLHAFFLVKRASRKIKEARSRAWRLAAYKEDLSRWYARMDFSLSALFMKAVQRNENERAGGRGKVRVILECAWCLHISEPGSLFSARFAHQSKSCIGRSAARTCYCEREHQGSCALNSVEKKEQEKI